MVIRSRKSKKERQRNGKKGQAMHFKTLHRKPKIEQHKLPKNRLCRQVPGMVRVSAPHVAVVSIPNLTANVCVGFVI
jgi:hypothetical protein